MANAWAILVLLNHMNLLNESYVDTMTYFLAHIIHSCFHQGGLSYDQTSSILLHPPASTPFTSMPIHLYSILFIFLHLTSTLSC